MKGSGGWQPFFFKELDVDDGRKAKTESIYSCVAVGFLKACSRMAACVCAPLKGELGMALRLGPNMHRRTYPADNREARRLLL